MVIDLGKGGLFGTRALEQETGLIKGRYAQDGSSIVNINFVNTTSGSKYTVTSGMRLFIDFIAVSESGSAGDGLLLDGGAAGTIKFAFVNDDLANGTLGFNLSTPLYFDTDVYFTETAVCNGYITMTGWEERLQ